LGSEIKLALPGSNGGLINFAFAAGMVAAAFDIRHFFHGFALHAAVITSGDGAGAGWVSAFLFCFGFHISP